MVLCSQITPDAFLHTPPGLSSSTVKSDVSDRPGKQHQQPTLVFFLTGNPGLVSYYHPFLSLISKRKDGRPRQDAVVAGLSLGGFEVDRPAAGPVDLAGSSATDLLLFPPASRARGFGGILRIYTLREQLELAYDRIDHLVGQLRADFPAVFARAVDVVLVGHSLGTYMALELVRMRHERRQRQRVAWRVGAAVLLTPTIVDLHLSPRGRAVAPFVAGVHCLRWVGHVVATQVLARLPRGWLESVVRNVAGMAEESHGLEATVRFLVSGRGVWQSLSLGVCELTEMREDRWGSEVWGGDAGAGAVDKEEDIEDDRRDESPRLYLWFAGEDGWVADETRAEIVEKRGGGRIERHARFGEEAGVYEETRGSEQSKAEASGDEKQVDIRIRISQTDELAHDWCLAQSTMVAMRVNRWLDEIMDVPAP